MNFKNLVMGAFMALAVAAAPGFSGQARAETKIAVVDVQKVMTESDAAKSVQKQLDAQRETFKNDFSKQKTDFQKIEQDILKSKSTLSEEDFAKKKAEHEKKVDTANKALQERRRQMERSVGAAMSDLKVEITKIVAGIAEKEKYDLVLTRQNVILSANSLDITDAVMKKMNETVKEIKLKTEKAK